MMQVNHLFFCFLLLISTLSLAQPASEKKEVLQVVGQFFDALEKQDTLAWNNVFLKDARNYFIGLRNDTLRAGMQDPFNFRFRKGQIIKERMRDKGVSVQIHEKIAMVWAPYDLWVNDTYSHCGVDVFTLLKTSAGWKVASCSFTIEKDGCGNPPKIK